MEYNVNRVERWKEPERPWGKAKIRSKYEKFKK